MTTTYFFPERLGGFLPPVVVPVVKSAAILPRGAASAFAIVAPVPFATGFLFLDPSRRAPAYRLCRALREGFRLRL
jgi:hypothetical protein